LELEIRRQLLDPARSWASVKKSSEIGKPFWMSQGMLLGCISDGRQNDTKSSTPRSQIQMQNRIVFFSTRLPYGG